MTPTPPEAIQADAEPQRADGQDEREALRKALELSKYAAAPFFSDQVRMRHDDGESYYIQPTTEEWWEGLREQIEAVQPLLEDALASPSVGVQVLPVAPAGWRLETGTGGFSEKGDRWVCVRHLESQCGQDFHEDRDRLMFNFLSALASLPLAGQPAEPQATDLGLGASASQTACSVASLPEPEVSALRVPPAGAEVTPSQLYEAIAAEFSDDGVPWSRQKGDLRRAYKTYACIINMWSRRVARGIDSPEWVETGTGSTATPQEAKRLAADWRAGKAGTGHLLAFVDRIAAQGDA